MSMVAATVLANCHSLPLAEALALVGRDIAASSYIDVNFLHQPEMMAKAEAALQDEARMILSINLSDRFGELATERLKERCGARLRSFTNLHFAGLHPDITYLGPMNRRVKGSLGDYHSKIVLFCFASGRNERDCLGLFNGAFYQKAGYFGMFETAAQSLRQRDEACDIGFAAAFLDMVREVPCLYSINHPTGDVLLALAKVLAAACGSAIAPFGASYFQNHLAANCIWPIYDELAEHHGLRYRTPPYFVAARGAGRRALALAEFVASSYAAYGEAAVTEELVSAVRKMPFYDVFSGCA